jgi:hypothetical protein
MITEPLASPTDVRMITEPELRGARDDILMKHHTGDCTLCDVIREIYEIGKKLNSTEIQEKCLVVIVYAKKMDRKLREYASEKEVSNG